MSPTKEHKDVVGAVPENQETVEHEGARLESAKGGTPEPIPDEVNRLSRIVVDAAFKVHSALGPGLL